LILKFYFDKLAPHSFDPNAFVEDNGKLVRASKRRERNLRYASKNRSKEAARVAAWRSANPDSVAAQNERKGSRNYHRPFISIDAEGETIPGFDETDANGNVYPLHRTTLWAAAGWRRTYTPEAIAAGLGSPMDGEETKLHVLVREDKKPHHSDEIIEWLLGLPALHGKEQGFLDGVNFVSFAFNYDATQALADLPFEKVWEITRKKSFKFKRKINSPTFYREYAIDFLKGKWLKLWKLRDRNKPYKEKLDKDGNVKLKKNGKPEMEIDAISYIGIDDAFGFYQSKFTKATKPLIKQGYVKKEDHEKIEYMKEHREEFDNMPMSEIMDYCHKELVFLSKALTVLRDGFDKMGETDAAYEARVKEVVAKGESDAAFTARAEAARAAGLPEPQRRGKPAPVRRGLRLRSWSGAGAAAGAKIRYEGLKQKHYSPDITVSKDAMTPWQEQSHRSFIGGRIEPVMQGYAMDRVLVLYDIVSAYPWPCWSCQACEMEDGLRMDL
jgi:hypothetical protein